MEFLLVFNLKVELSEAFSVFSRGFVVFEGSDRVLRLFLAGDSVSGADWRVE